MIIINLKGGTGNQLFQYALGRHLAIKNNTELKLDVAGLDRAIKTGDLYRPLKLNSFNHVATIATAEEIKKLKYPYGIISKGWRWFAFKILRQTNIIFRPEVMNWSGDIYLDGYWQSPRYFNAIRDTLLQELTLAKPLVPEAEAIAAQMAQTNSVSLHVRRTDYLAYQQRTFGICSKDYYAKAMAYVAEHVTNPTYFVFSDDIEWVKANLPIGANAVYLNNPAISDVEELTLMSKCKHNIIANSSFSWWGAWLNQHAEKIVIAPSPWFDSEPSDEKLIPDSWIQLPKV